MTSDDSFSIEELARAADMTPRNVRAYRTKGLLPPPVRTGRASQYRVAHLYRLRDIRQLRDAGLPLKLITEAAQRGEDLGPHGLLGRLAASRGASPTELSPGDTSPGEQLERLDASSFSHALLSIGLPADLANRVSQLVHECCTSLVRELDVLLAEYALDPDPRARLVQGVRSVAGDAARRVLAQAAG